MKKDLYLGIDGGQSHTEAVIADAGGSVLGRGRGGASNHAEQTGGRERLRRAITESVGAALGVCGLGAIEDVEFAFAHCAMTGGADYKEEIIGAVLHARGLSVGHDAPAALAGATGGGAGIVIIAGTGSVAYGETANNKSLRVGGWGFLFGDEGGAFGIAAEAVRRTCRAVDGLSAPTALVEHALAHFAVADLPTLVQAVYHEEITRDLLATFAPIVDRAADEGDAVARDVMTRAAQSLVSMATTTARSLELNAPHIAPVGGVFRSKLINEIFGRELVAILPGARIIEPRFDPATGALLLAYRAAGRAFSEDLLRNLERQGKGLVDAQ